MKNNKSFAKKKRGVEVKNDNGMAFCWMRYPQAEEIAHPAAEEAKEPAQPNLPEHTNDVEPAKKNADKLAEDTAVKPFDHSAAEEAIESAQPTLPEQANDGESSQKEARVEGYPNEAIEIADKLAGSTFGLTAIKETNESTQPTLPEHTNNGEPSEKEANTCDLQDEAVENANKLDEDDVKPSGHSAAEETIESAKPPLPEQAKETEGNQDDAIEIAEKLAEETMDPVQLTLPVQANDKETSTTQEVTIEGDTAEALETKNKPPDGAASFFSLVKRLSPFKSTEKTPKAVDGAQANPTESADIDAICLGIHKRKLKNAKK